MSGDSPDPDDTGADGPEDGDRLRGWIPPDARPWRHPSELGAGGGGVPAPPPAAPGGRSGSGRPVPWLVAGAAVCVVGALLVGGLLLADTGATPTAGTAVTTSSIVSPPTTEAGARLTAASDLTRMVAVVRPSLVTLLVSKPSGDAQATGVIAASGGVVVTVAAAVAGATAVDTVEPGGRRERATLVGTDAASGLAVLRVATDLPAATFDLQDPAPGTTAVAVAVSGRSLRSHPPALVYAGTVRSSGTAVGADAPTTEFASTAVDTPLGAPDTGCALVDPAGQVWGILDTTQSQGSATVSVFLPAELVLDVAQRLMAGGPVDRGWLGVDASDMDGTTPDGSAGGARIDTVVPGGAAARAGLEVGDAIVAVDGNPVHSLAELRARLYAEVPGTDLTLAFDRSGAMGTATVVLAGSASGGSPAGSSG